jgi:hypothetical protein
MNLPDHTARQNHVTNWFFREILSYDGSGIEILWIHTDEMSSDGN